MSNFLRLFEQSQPWEVETGFHYYDRQREKIRYAGRDHTLSTGQLVGAFAALSPNSSESNNYQALRTCLAIVSGELPESARVIGYTPNKVKALKILRGGLPLDILGGRKVRAFFHNTMNPNDGDVLTIDGHMYNIWTNQRRRLKAERRPGRDKAETVPHIGQKLYESISDELRASARHAGMKGPRFQAVLWITWKRVHNIVYSPVLSGEQRGLPLRYGYSFGH